MRQGAEEGGPQDRAEEEAERLWPSPLPPVPGKQLLPGWWAAAGARPPLEESPREEHVESPGAVVIVSLLSSRSGTAAAGAKEEGATAIHGELPGTLSRRWTQSRAAQKRRAGSSPGTSGGGGGGRGRRGGAEAADDADEALSTVRENRYPTGETGLGSGGGEQRAAAKDEAGVKAGALSGARGGGGGEKAGKGEGWPWRPGMAELEAVGDAAGEHTTPSPAGEEDGG